MQQSSITVIRKIGSYTKRRDKKELLTERQSPSIRMEQVPLGEVLAAKVK